MKFQAPRGTHDVLPSEQPLWQLATGTLAEVAETYGYGRIQTPVFEDAELFLRTSGQGSDVVQKEMYVFEDRGGRMLALRPEGTAPICRAYLEHGMQREPQPVKLYTQATMYRYAAPQKGRYREHWQQSVEAIGSDDPAIDAEVIQLYVEVLRRLGVSQYELQLNSIGDANCRPAYVEKLVQWLDANDASLDDEARQKRATSPLRVFDVKSPSVRAALAGAPKIGESLCDACREHFAEVRRYLDALGVAYTLEPTLVRGLDYYTRTTFEFVGPDEGAQSTICAGGRYDGLIEQLGGPPTPGIGFGAGIERLLQALEHEGVTAELRGLDLFFLIEPDADRAAALAELAKLRAAGVSCDADYAGRSLKGQRTQLARSGARGFVHVRADGATIKRGDVEQDVPVGSVAATV
ncbi:MAG TPA: histidine--tRNA ligase, partial [Gaiellaceae bacterium]|nr:histidine--tRNA ligase [Gaiellaceae bacterium]